MVAEAAADTRATIAAAKHLLVLTGAGISAESGVPTFREAQTGLWERYDPSQLATPEAFAEDPELVWSWYRWRRSLIREVEPNPGHAALAHMQEAAEARDAGFTLVTQNVDGLHAVAGSRDVVEFHGNIFDERCSRCHRPGATSGPEVETPPSCESCGGPMRPGVVWFGERIPEQALEAATTAAGRCDLCLVVGTSSLVHPAAGLPEIALAAGARVIEVNPETTPLSPRCDRVLRGTAAQVLPGLV